MEILLLGFMINGITSVFPLLTPFLSSNIPSAPAYGVYVSQLIRYARACSNYQDFMERGKELTTKLLSQGYQKTKLVTTRSSLGDIMIWSIPTMWQFPELFLMFLPMTRHKQTSQIPDIRFYRYFLRSGLWAWWAKLA